MRLPQFPLQLVAFPQETIRLHIFEERYKKLISECLASDQTFGIVPFISGVISDYGTEVRLQKVYHTFEDGRQDIACLGDRIYKVNKFHKVPKDEGYSFAEVEFIKSHEEAGKNTREKTIELLRELFDKLKTPPNLELTVDNIHTSLFIHKLGLSLDKEYDLLVMMDEESRLRSINDYLLDFIPQLDRAEEIRKRIQSNGHFKRLNPLDF